LSFESLPAGRDRNHFNLLRLVAASSVIVSHSYYLATGPGAKDPLERLTGFDLGTTAVIAFFAISGYFISLSFDRRHSNVDFILARVTRIVPGLLVVALLCAFLLGPLFTFLPAPAYFAKQSVWLYPLRTVSIVWIMHDSLPGVFVHNPIPIYVNGSLWTLFYEAACYAGLFAAGTLGLLRGRRFLLLLLAWVPAYVAARYGPWPHLHYFASFSLPFVLGMAVYRYREAGILKSWAAALLIVVAVGTALSGLGVEELWAAAIAYGILWLGFAPGQALQGYNRLGDYSYGTYIYGFPLQQSVAALVPGIAPMAMTALSLPAAILLGALSWHCVERPSLQLRKGGPGLDFAHGFRLREHLPEKWRRIPD
jgi:peptidoglycan/LPS O-acetylase OafA/YrhL